ncbi:MAG: hypothetical protein GY861_16960 [bacterium]|nr:hypothetical protein [bacterium]
MCNDIPHKEHDVQFTSRDVLGVAKATKNITFQRFMGEIMMEPTGQNAFDHAYEKGKEEGKCDRTKEIRDWLDKSGYFTPLFFETFDKKFPPGKKQ